MAEEPRKRSRFDQTDSEPPRKSRFDRRSRSPGGKEAEPSRRSRSPIQSPNSENSKKDAAEKAAAAAAKINASFSAKKGVQHVDVPPIRANPSPGAGAGAAKSPTENKTSGTLNEDIYQQDGDYIRDIEVNDLRNRYTLTKGSTQKMIKEKTGADVTTRGNYYPDKSMATPSAPPLYLHITSLTKDGLEQAVAEIEELKKQDLPNLIDERRFRRREPQEPQVERDSLGRRKWPEERIPVDLEPIPGFNLRAQVVGQGGAYVKHIQQEYGCRVQIKGRGSGFIEHDTQRESDEQMYLHVNGPDAEKVKEAADQCRDLLQYVKGNYESFKASRDERERQGGGYGGGRGGGYGPRDRNGSNSYGGGSQYGGGSSYGGGSAYGGNSQYGGYNQQPPPPPPPPDNNYGGSYGGGYGNGAQSPPAAQAQAQQQQQPQMTPDQMHAWAAYYAQYPDSDPYAAYGGFGVAMQHYLGQQAQAPPQAPPQQASPPPPPPPPPGV